MACFVIGDLKLRPAKRWEVFSVECIVWHDQGARLEDTWEGTGTNICVLETRGRLRRSLFQTKHFQTLFWTPDVRLVDCPGLVIPNFVPMETQVSIHRDRQ